MVYGFIYFPQCQWEFDMFKIEIVFIVVEVFHGKLRF